MDISKLTERELKEIWEKSSTNRRERAKRFYHFDDAKRCLAAGILLKYLLHITENAEQIIQYNTYKKPYIQVDNLYFNLSHSGKWVVLAYGKSEVGVDIEEITVEDPGVREWCFSEEECRYIDAGKDRDSSFTKLWTLKESYVKFIGTGLTDDLKNRSVFHPDRNAISFYSTEWDEHYFLSLCGYDKDVQVERILWSDMQQYFKYSI